MRSISKMAIVAGMLGFAGAASATPTTIIKGQYAENWQGSWNHGNFTTEVGNPVPFGTTKIVADRKNGTLTLDLYTTFTGSYFSGGDCFGSVCANAADIALSIGSSGYNYGISLGKQGVSAGLYLVNSWQRATDIWGNRFGFIYGGKWSTCSGADCSDANTHDADTRIATGTKLADASVKDMGSYLEVTVKAGVLNKSLGLYWGTADCGNDPIAGNLPSNVPEPASLALLGSAIAGLGLVRRRKG